MLTAMSPTQFSVIARGVGRRAGTSARGDPDEAPGESPDPRAEATAGAADPPAASREAISTNIANAASRASTTTRRRSVPRRAVNIQGGISADPADDGSRSAAISPRIPRQARNSCTRSRRSRRAAGQFRGRIAAVSRLTPPPASETVMRRARRPTRRRSKLETSREVALIDA